MNPVVGFLILANLDILLKHPVRLEIAATDHHTGLPVVIGFQYDVVPAWMENVAND